MNHWKQTELHLLLEFKEADGSERISEAWKGTCILVESLGLPEVKQSR